MSEYDDISTPVLKEMVAQARTEADSLIDEKIELEKRLAVIQEARTGWITSLREHEAELREREPEFGGTYPHPAGFAYQSFRGRDRWEYRIIGTTVLVRDVVVPNYGVCHESICSEHGTVGGPAQNQLEDELGFAYRHFTDRHA